MAESKECTLTLKYRAIFLCMMMSILSCKARTQTSESKGAPVPATEYIDWKSLDCPFDSHYSNFLCVQSAKGLGKGMGIDCLNKVTELRAAHATQDVVAYTRLVKEAECKAKLHARSTCIPIFDNCVVGCLSNCDCPETDYCYNKTCRSADKAMSECLYNAK